MLEDVRIIDWSVIPERVHITIDIASYGDSEIFSYNGVKSVKILCINPFSVLELSLLPYSEFYLIIPINRISNDFHRMLNFKGLLNKPVRIIFERTNLARGTVHSIKPLL